MQLTITLADAMGYTRHHANMYLPPLPTQINKGNHPPNAVLDAALSRPSLVLLRHIRPSPLVALPLVIVVLLLLLLPPALLPQRLGNRLVLLVLQFVPLDIVLVRHGLDLLAQGVAFFDERLPLGQVEAALGVELLLAPRDGEVHGGFVRDFAVVVEEPDVAADQGG